MTRERGGGGRQGERWRRGVSHHDDGSAFAQRVLDWARASSAEGLPLLRLLPSFVIWAITRPSVRPSDRQTDSQTMLASEWRMRHGWGGEMSCILGETAIGSFILSAGPEGKG